MHQVKAFLGVASLGVCLILSVPALGHECGKQVERSQSQPGIDDGSRLSSSGFEERDGGDDRTANPTNTRQGESSRGFDDYSGSSSSNGNSDLF